MTEIYKWPWLSKVSLHSVHINELIGKRNKELTQALMEGTFKYIDSCLEGTFGELITLARSICASQSNKNFRSVNEAIDQVILYEVFGHYTITLMEDN